jgi:hypothetical protein
MTNLPKALLQTPLLRRRAVSSLGATLALLLVPKCPLCVAAYLASLGIGAEAATSAAPLVRPLAWLLMALAVSALGIGLWRSRRDRTAWSFSVT